MSTDTITVSVKVADILSRNPLGLTARKIAGIGTLSLRDVGQALSTMEANGTATRTEGERNGNRKGADIWTPTTDTTSTPNTDVTASTDAPMSGAPVSGAPVSGGPASGKDYLKVVMVAGILADHPDGVSAADVVDESGLRAPIVGRVLGAMELVGVAMRTPATDVGGVELWTHGDGDLVTVDLTQTATREVCPNCHRPMPRRANSVNVRRTVSAAPGQNGNGQKTLAKNELRNLVRDFLNAHPGHVFNATTISREIGRSSGAIGNALAKLVLAGEAVMVTQDPMTYSAAPATDTTTATEAPAGK
jgi:hypothetical protein